MSFSFHCRFGSHPPPLSWGRILAATGAVDLSTPIDPDSVNVSFVPADGSASLPVLVNGEPENVDEVRAKEILSEEEFEIKVNIGLGGGSAKYWTCDFSYVSCIQVDSASADHPGLFRNMSGSTGTIEANHIVLIRHRDVVGVLCQSIAIGAALHDSLNHC
jgi:hypothetical protein